MVDFALDAERRQEQQPEQSIYQAALLRFRPIMMTTMAALLGALPLAFSTGGSAELRQPLGITSVGGLVFSQVLTLYSTPVVYLYLARVSRLFRRRGVRQELPVNEPRAVEGKAPYAAEMSASHKRPACN